MVLFKPKLSIVSTAFNEQLGIEEFIRRVDKTLTDNNLNGEIVMVDDGSKDKTLAIMESLQPHIGRLKVIAHRKNRGLTTAIATGIENSSHDYILFLPSDLESHPEEDIPKLLAPLNEGYDLTVGWRVNRRQGFLKTQLSEFFNWLSRKMFQVNVHDLGWVKAFKKEIYYNVEALRADWHRYFVILAAKEGYKIKEVRTKFYPRRAGRSHFGKIGLKRIPGGVFDLIVIKFLTSFSLKPMRMFGGLGFLMLIFGILFSMYLLYLNLTIGHVYDRVLLIMVILMLFLASLQLFAIGFLAELIVSGTERKISRGKSK